MVDELFGRAFFHDHAAIHEQDAVGHIAGKVHLMGDNDHRGLAVSKITQDLQHLAGQLRVKGAGGLIKAEDIRVKRQRAGNGHTLLLAAGELMRVVAGPLRKAHLRQQFSRLLFQLRVDSLFICLILRAFLCQQFSCQHHVL